MWHGVRPRFRGYFRGIFLYLGVLDRLRGSSWRYLRQQFWQPDQIVGGERQCEGRIDAPAPSELGLVLAGLDLDPAKNLLDPFADTLADRVARMPRRAAIDLGLAPLAGLGEVVLNGDMGRHVARTQIINKSRHVKALVASQGDPPLAALTIHRAVLVDHRQRLFAFRRAGGQADAAANRQAVAVLHKGMAHETYLALTAIALAVKPGVGIGGALVGLVGALKDCYVPKKQWHSYKNGAESKFD